MSKWDAILNDATNMVGASSSITGRVFDFINAGGASSVGVVRDINTNGFLATDSVYVPKYFVRMFDEPTYLTFKLEFLFHNTRNSLFSNDLATQWSSYDPTNATKGDNGSAEDHLPAHIYSMDGDTEHAYDYLPEAFLQDSMLAQNDGYFVYEDKSGYWPQAGGRDASGNNVPLNDNSLIGYYYSAEDYLGLNRGEFGRAQLLRKIKMILKDLQDNFPYYFRSIDGLSDLNKITPNSGKRVGDDVVLTIKCYEGLDLKITQLLQMIRKVTWDDCYQRWVLPDIMRYFGMRIYVSEIRTFHEAHALVENGFRLSPKLNLYNFRDEDGEGSMRNATELPMKTNWYQKIMSATSQILTAAQALGNQFFEDTTVNNIISEVNNTVNAYSNMVGSLSGIYQTMCVSAINEVMPTICYECHMCEFDVSDTAMELNTLHSTSGDPQEQTLRIKVKQVEDFQIYPLDRNLGVNAAKTGYALDARMYGYRTDADVNNPDEVEYYSNQDDEKYRNRRAEGLTGSTVFSDQVFNETFNGAKREQFDKARQAGNTVNEMSLYRNLASRYNDAVINYFTNLGYTILKEDTQTPISPRQNMYPGDRAKDLMYRNNGRALHYKRNTLDTFTNVMTLLINGLNTVGGVMSYSGAEVNSLNNFSRATGITREDLESTLPEVHAAALALRETARQYNESDFNDTNLGQYAMLQQLAYSKATRYSPIGQMAGAVLNSEGTGAVSGPWSTPNRYKESPYYGTASVIGEDAFGMKPTYDNRYVSSPNGVRPQYWSTISQNPDYNRTPPGQ